MNTILENLSKKHKDFQQFKQLIKRQSQALSHYLNELIEISRQFNSQIFNGIHYHLFQFQSELQNQYVLLKQLGQNFYDVKKEAQSSFKNLAKINLKLDKNSTLKQKQINQETKIFWTQQFDYATIRINDMSTKFDQIISKTSCKVENFIKFHKMDFIINSNFKSSTEYISQQFQSSLKSSKQTDTIKSLYFSELIERESMSETDKSKDEREYTQTYIENLQNIYQNEKEI